jgi:hypothetical protein
MFKLKCSELVLKKKKGMNILFGLKLFNKIIQFSEEAQYM